MQQNNLKKMLVIREAAQILGVHPETLRRWDKDGKLRAIIINQRGDRRYSAESINKYLQNINKKNK